MLRYGPPFHRGLDMTRDEQERELLNAMADGVRKYLETTKGLAVFGANASVIVADDNLVITSPIGEYVFFSSTDLS